MKSIEITLLLKAFQAEKDANSAVRGTTVVFHYHFKFPIISVYLPGGDYTDVILFSTDGDTFSPYRVEDFEHPDLKLMKALVEERFFLEYKPNEPR